MHELSCLLHVTDPSSHELFLNNYNNMIIVIIYLNFSRLECLKNEKG